MKKKLEIQDPPGSRFMAVPAFHRFFPYADPNPPEDLISDVLIGGFDGLYLRLFYFPKTETYRIEQKDDPERFKLFYAFNDEDAKYLVENIYWEKVR